MHEEVWYNYYGRRVAVTKEVADYLNESRKEIRSSNRRYKDWNTNFSQFDCPEWIQNVNHHTGRDTVLDKVIRNERRDWVRRAVKGLPGHLQRLYYLRYVKDLTQQEIADREGVSKMAVCKRLKKLHELVKASIPDWVGEECLEDREPGIGGENLPL